MCILWSYLVLQNIHVKNVRSKYEYLKAGIHREMFRVYDTLYFTSGKPYHINSQMKFATHYVSTKNIFYEQINVFPIASDDTKDLEHFVSKKKFTVYSRVNSLKTRHRKHWMEVANYYGPAKYKHQENFAEIMYQLYHLTSI